MRTWKTGCILLSLSIAATGFGNSETPLLEVPQYQAPDTLRYTATTIEMFVAPEADQGVAVDRTHFYAVDNSVIGKYVKSSGAFVERWISPKGGPIDHMNSCFEDADKLWCANSNYSETPMASSIEVFSTEPLAHLESHSLGLMDEGSLTWFDRYEDGWIAAFAHYDGDDGGLAFKGHRFTGIVTFDSRWRRTGGWMLPNSVLARLEPDAVSGGQIGPDGLLYILGHDRPEMYVLAKPKMGPKLVHIATIDIELEGQAFAWDRSADRAVFGIDRRIGLVRSIEVPEVDMAHPNATIFR